MIVPTIEGPKTIVGLLITILILLLLFGGALLFVMYKLGNL